MTENKRFVDYFDKEHNYIIQDLQNEEEYQVGYSNCDEDLFLNLVNELSQENERLYEENIAYENDRTRYKEEIRLEFYEKIQTAYNNERTNLGKSVLKQLMESL